MDRQYPTPKIMEQHLRLLRHLKSKPVASVPTTRRALRSSGYNLQKDKESSCMDEDLLYHQASTPYYNPNMYSHSSSCYDDAPVRNNVQCSYEFVEEGRDSCQTNQIYCNTTANCVPQEVMDALKWAIEGIKELRMLPKQENLSQPFNAFNLSSVTGDGASNRIDIEDSQMSDDVPKKSMSDTEKDMQLDQLINLVRLTILKLDSYITLTQKQQQIDQQRYQMNIEPFLMPSELPPHVDMITDPALQSMLFNKIRQKVRPKRTVKVMPVQPLVIIQPSKAAPPDPPTQTVNTTRSVDRYRVRKRRRQGGVESSHYSSAKKKRDCGTTMWCPNPDCQCSNGLTSKPQECRVDFPQPQSCETSETKKNSMSVGQEVDMRSTSLPKLLKKLLRKHMCPDNLRSESPLGFTEDENHEQQQLDHEQQVDFDEDWEYPTGYRGFELEPEEEWSHLPNNMYRCKHRPSEASSQTDCHKHKQRKCERTVHKSSLKCKGSHKVKFHKHLVVKDRTDDEHEKAEGEATSARTRSPKCRVLKSMKEAVQRRSCERSLPEEYSRRCKGGADTMLPSYYPTKWTQ